MNKQYHDTSIMQGVVEFASPRGAFRATSRGFGRYDVAIKQRDALGSYYMQIAQISVSGKATPRKIFNALLETGF